MDGRPSKISVEVDYDGVNANQNNVEWLVRGVKCFHQLKDYQVLFFFCQREVFVSEIPLC